jgi:RNA polymerase sigma factor (sigma-70 family)
MMSTFTLTPPKTDSPRIISKANRTMTNPKPTMQVASEEVQHLSDKAIKDYQLVMRAAEHGDQKAYAELMSRYKDSIYYMLLKMVNNRDDAEDLTIEAFGKAFRNIKQYTPDYAFSTWLFKIATNNCIDFIRKKRKMMLSIDRGFENEDGQEVGIELKSDGPSPDDVMIKKQKVMMMKDVVEKLKPRYRRLVEMRYYQELSYEEIAVELDLPLGTVKAQLFRAREFLYQIMKNSDYQQEN